MGQRFLVTVLWIIVGADVSSLSIIFVAGLGSETLLDD
jgi:hypothetical protein